MSAEENAVLSNERSDWFNKPWLSVPITRFAWGELQSDLNPGGPELILDLIFVGVAYRVGVVLKAAIYQCVPPEADVHMRSRSLAASTTGECIGIHLGFLHGLAPFVAMFQIWSYTTAMKAKYSSASKLQTMLDVLSSLLLVFAAMGISPSRGLHSSLHMPSSSGSAHDTSASSSDDVQRRLAESAAVELDADAFAYVVYPIVLVLLLWLVRFAELAFFSRRECARRENVQEFIIGFQVLCMWGGAAALVSMDNEQMDEAHAERADWAAGLLWCGNLWWNLARAVNPLLSFRRPASKRVPVERALVCPHHGYNYHRTNEFMFLMLGETVLQIVIAAGPRSSAPASGREHWMVLTRATAFGGFVLAVCMMHTFRSIVNEQIEGRHEVNAVMGKRAEEEKSMMSQIEEDTHRISAHHDFRSCRRASVDEENDGSPGDDKGSGDKGSSDRPSRGADAEKSSPETSPDKPSRRRRRSSSGEMMAKAISGAFNSAWPLHSATPSPPHSSHDMALRRSRRRSLIDTMNTKQMQAIQLQGQAQKTIRIWLAVSAFELFLWQLNAIAVLLVGASIKICVYNPLEWAPGKFALEQRFLLGVPVAGTFVIQLFYAVYMKNRHHYYALSQLRRFPAHTAVIGCRLLLLACSVAVCAVELWPLAHVWLQALFAVLQVVLLHAQHKFPIHSDRKHPLEGPVETSFDAMRLKALRYRDRQSFSNLSPLGEAHAAVAAVDGSFTRTRRRHTVGASVSAVASMPDAPSSAAAAGNQRPARWMRDSKESMNLPVLAAEDSAAVANGALTVIELQP